LTGTVSAAAATLSGNLTLSGGTANGVAYLNGSKVVTSGSALTFDGTNLLQATGGSAAIFRVGSTVSSGRAATINLGNNAGTARGTIALDAGTELMTIGSEGNFGVVFQQNGTEGMRLTSTGLGIGTSSPVEKVQSSKGVAATGANQSVGSLNGFVADYSSGASRIFASRNGVASSTLELWTTDSGGAANKNATLDSSGNLGLGVTPSANWTSAGSQKAMQVGTYGALSSSGTGAGGYYQTVLGMNCVDHTTSTKYLNTGVATAYVQATGQHQWLTAPSGTAGNAITFTQAMTLDASGNLGLGTTSLNLSGGASGSQVMTISASSSGRNGILELNGTRTTSGDYVGYVRFFNNGAATPLADIQAIRGSSDTTGVLAFATGNTERARIDTSGNFGLGQNNPTFKLDVFQTGSVNIVNVKGDASDGSALARFWQAADSGDNGFMGFLTQSAGTGTTRGSITYNRGAGLVAYNITSDYRAKDITGAVSNSGALIDSVPVYMGKMKDATQERPMFIAHETPAYAHTGEKDAVDEHGNPVYQQMDASALIPVMWAEIQSLRKRLADAGIA
jgi:hypothetical protein